MKRGGDILCSVAVLAMTGCGGSDAKLAIRSIPAPLSATSKPVPYRIAEAHGHLALGNVALAIESFRKALREQHDSVDAMVGLAGSYYHMARFDLSRRYYESALAIAPA
jgi:Tfp pilus assembly protein PilF